MPNIVYVLVILLKPLINIDLSLSGSTNGLGVQRDIFAIFSGHFFRITFS